jgi:murein DD-endopeptidase MepM/ murein hydrolase activator NlpD
MNQETESIVVEFPLRGEWVALNTPAERIPSHGTDWLGQRFAFDFARIETGRKNFKFYRSSILSYLLFGVKLQACYGWSQPIYAPFDGTVISSKDGWGERKRAHVLTDIAAIRMNARNFRRQGITDLRSVAGNYIILKMDWREVYALLAHARCGSVQVREGEEVRLGQHLADVGHSGNSTAPHLHFHLMDRANILEAQGLPCRFREYQVLRNGAWEKVTNGIPRKWEFFKFESLTDSNAYCR